MDGPRAVLWGATAVAAALRLYALGDPSLWNDELSTWRRQRPNLLSDEFWKLVNGDVHPPGYQIVMHLWCMVFGDSEVALRLPSALSGIATVPALFVLCGRLFDRRAAALAAVFTAISGQFLHFMPRTAY